MNTPSGKPDFSIVQGSVTSTEQTSEKPDFSKVQSPVTSTEEVVGSSDSARTYTVVKGDTLYSDRQAFLRQGEQLEADL